MDFKGSCQQQLSDAKGYFCLFERQVQFIPHRYVSTYRYTEMEFLDISLTKDSSHLLHAIHSPFYWLILKTILFSGLTNPYKKSAKKKNLSLFMNSIL